MTRLDGRPEDSDIVDVPAVKLAVGFLVLGTAVTMAAAFGDISRLWLIAGLPCLVIGRFGLRAELRQS